MWLARLVLSAAPPPQRLRAWLEATDEAAGFSLSDVRADGSLANRSHRSGGGLAGPRNAGVLLGRSGGFAAELTDIAPWTVAHRHSGRVQRHRAPPSFSSRMHNSISPLWVPELSAYLGVAHLHYSAGIGDERHDKDRGEVAPFSYGFRYRHVLFTLPEHSASIDRYSRELCFPTLDAAAGPAASDAACDGIQFVMGAFRPSKERGAPVGLAYGVNDCEAAVLTLSLERLGRLLEFRHESRSAAAPERAPRHHPLHKAAAATAPPPDHRLP